ncbi:MAG: hypothetical protein HJJLKODD_00023 [Phycisphaerae bacterium]|nr:hypothetical protein [Phycisphaerae bacterium]
MITSFPSNIHDQLKYYIYLYIDPQDNSIFYVGLGQKNRVFAHLHDDSESQKVKRIKAIQDAGHEPIIHILVHGLEEYPAKKIEASIIDLLDRGLTNEIKGYESREFGRMDVEQILAQYAAQPAKILEQHAVILIKINRSFRQRMSAVELYDATRCCWKINPQRHQPKYAFAVYHSVVQEVYEIVQWVRGGQTFNTLVQIPLDSDRWEFVGRIAPEPLRKRYRYKNVSEYVDNLGQNPITYVNC